MGMVKRQAKKPFDHRYVKTLAVVCHQKLITADIVDKIIQVLTVYVSRHRRPVVYGDGGDRAVRLQPGGFDIQVSRLAAEVVEQSPLLTGRDAPGKKIRIAFVQLTAGFDQSVGNGLSFGCGQFQRCITKKSIPIFDTGRPEALFGFGSDARDVYK
jgi:hypothetical protein